MFDGAVIGPVIDTAGKLRILRQFGEGVITSTDGWGDVDATERQWRVGAPGGRVDAAAGRLDRFVEPAARRRVGRRRQRRGGAQGPSLPYEPMGVAYSTTGTFYVNKWTCDFNSTNDVTPDMIMRLEPA